jgi:glycerophosphoryl diester phosphodiesterase
VPKPLVIAHRGASRVEVENSLAAFRAAAPRGADGVELDVHTTRDGALIVHHDERVEGGQRIPAMTCEQARRVRLANGEPLPTLEEALAAVSPRLRVFVEAKTLDSRFDQRLLGTLAQGPNPSAYAVHSFDHRVIARLGRERPTLERGVLSASYPVRPLSALEDAGATTLWQDRGLVDAALVALVHDAGYALIVWTVDEEDEMQRLLALGIDGLCTNAPDLARRTVDAWPG